MTEPNEPDTPPVDATYTVTPDDLAGAARLHYRAEARRWPTLLAAVVSLAILGSILRVVLPDDPRGFAFVLACGMLGAVAVPFAMIRWVVPRQARRTHARSKLARAPVRLHADASAVRLADPDGEIRIPWSGIVRWREDAHVILLYYARSLFHVVPRQALANDACAALRRFHDRGRHARSDDGERPGLDVPRIEGGIPSTAPVLAASQSWSVTRADLVAAQRLYLRWRWRRPRAMLSPLLLAGCAGLVTVASDPVTTWWSVAAAMLGMLLVVAVLRAGLYTLLPLGTRGFRRRQPNLGLSWRVELDAVGLRALTAQQDVRTPWGAYVAWAEDARVVLVYRSEALFQFMPVRALDPGFRATFRSLVAGLPRR